MDLAGDSRHFDTVANRDRSFCEDDEAADEIARDILETEANPHAHRAGKDRQRSQMDPGVIKNNENADDQDDVADNLCDRVLQTAVEPALGQEAVEQEPFGLWGNPENRN